MNEWEEIIEDENSKLERIEVYSGYLYRSTTRIDDGDVQLLSESMIFVLKD